MEKKRLEEFLGRFSDCHLNIDMHLNIAKYSNITRHISKDADLKKRNSS